MPASGHQNHTTSPSASVLFVSSTISVHRIPSRVRDDREPPLCGTGRRGYNFDLGETAKGIFLQMRLDRANQIESFQQIRPRAQMLLRLLALDVPAIHVLPPLRHGRASSRPSTFFSCSDKAKDVDARDT